MGLVHGFHFRSKSYFGKQVAYSDRKDVDSSVSSGLMITILL